MYQPVAKSIVKKSLWALLALALCDTGPVRAQSAYFQAVTNLNPAAYWPLQETVPSPGADIETNYGLLGAAGNAVYSGTNVFRGVIGVTGDGDTAVRFLNANGSFLAVPVTSPGVPLPAGAFSVEAWVNPTNTSTGGAQIILAQTGPIGTGGLNGGANAAGWALVQNFYPSQNNKNFLGWAFHVFNGVGAAGGAEAVLQTNYTINTWYHLVGVFDGTNAYLYVNGVNNSLGVSPIGGGGTNAQDTWDPLTIGCGAGLNNNKYAGIIDEVAVYTNALTAGQIQNHYNNVTGSGYSAIVTGDRAYLYWRMDAPVPAAPAALSASPVAANYGAVANINGLYLPGTTPGVAGPAFAGLGSPSYACAFNGIGTDSTNKGAIYTNGVLYSTNVLLNTGVIITNLPTPVLNPASNNISVAVWFKCNPSDDRFQTLFGHSDNSWRLALNNNGTLHWNPGFGSDLASSGLYNDGNWHFAVAVYANSGVGASPAGWLATNYLYVDGAFNGSAEVTNLAANTSNTNILLGGAPDYVMGGNNNAYNQRYFAGSLAHIAFFTNALTATQVLNLYTNATAGVLPAQPPFITSQPFPYPSVRQVAGGAGQYIFEAVVVAGPPSTTYQWYYNSSSNYTSATALQDDVLNYTNSQTSQVTITNLTPAKSGYYFCVVSDSFGSSTSAIVNVQVATVPVITAQSPAGAFSLFPNQGTSLSVTALGVTPLSYQWLTNGVADTAAGTGATYALANVQSGSSGETYQCVVTNIDGAVTSTVATLTVASFPAALLNSSYATNILALNPAGYWPMHEVEAPVAGALETNYGTLGSLANGYYADWATNQSLSTLVRQVPGALAGSSDPAVLFNVNVAANAGGPNYLLVPRTSPATTLQPPFTVEAWFNGQNNNFGDLVSESGNTNNSGGNGKIGFRLVWNGNFQIWNGGSEVSGLQSPAATDGQWYYVVATVDPNTNVTLYVNGNFIASVFVPNLVWDPSIPLTVGSGLWGTSGPGRPVDGAIDEVALYTNVLSGQRISAHYNSAIDPVDNGAYFTTVQADAPVVYLRMNAPAYVVPPQASWPVLTNYGTVPQNGVYSPGTMPGAVPGPNNGTGLAALSFSGTNAMLGNGLSSFADAGPVTGLGSPFNPSPWNTSFSYAVWFKGNPADCRSFQSLISANDATWRCSLNSSGKIQAHGEGSDVTSPAVYNDGNWHQVILTCVETNTTALTAITNILYVDGVAVASTVGGATNNPSSDPGPDVLIGDETGLTNNPSGTGRSLAGSVCEAAFFAGKVLTPGQVAALYSVAGIPPYIATQPVSANVNAGSAFTNTVAAGGSGQKTYQWYENNQPLPVAGQTNLPNGGTNATLVISPVSGTGSDAGTDYYVVVSSAYGSVTSAAVSLTVFTSPQFTNEPVDVTLTNNIQLFAGVTPTFTVGTIGAQPTYYQWFTNGVAATANATNLTSFTLPAVSLAAATNYFFCVASNFVGVTTNNYIAVTALPDPTAPYPMAVLAANPVAYWRLNEGNVDNYNNGTLANDYAGGNNGIYTNTILGNPGYSQSTDPSETCAEFGFDSFVNGDAYGIGGINFAAPTNSSATFTVEAWVNGYAQTKDAGIVSKGYGGGGEQFCLDTGSDTAPTSHGFRFYIHDASGVTHIVTSTVMPSYGNWYHLVGVCDEVNGLLTLYINGASVGSTALTPGSGLLSSSRNTIIGSRPSNSTTNNNDSQFVGLINDVAIYNYALSAAQVAQQYAQVHSAPNFAPAPPTNVVATGYQTLSINAGAVGTPSLEYTWYDQNGGTNLSSGLTNGVLLNASLTVSNVPPNWNGDTLVLTAFNSYGTTNFSVLLTVLTNAPVITQDLPPVETSVNGKSFAYEVGLSGPQPYSYQWYNNGAPVAGQTNAMYLVTAGSGSTTYYVIVTNAFGAVTSSVSTLITVPQLTNSFADSVLGLGPVGYWPLQETNAPAPVTLETNYGALGSIANAYYAMTNAGNVAFGQSGALAGGGDNDTAAYFNSDSTSSQTITNIDGYAFVPRLTPALTLRPPLSLECWVNTSFTTFGDMFGEGGGTGLNVASGGGNYGGIRACWQGSATGGSFEIYVANGNGTTRNFVSTPANDVSFGQWHHLVATYDGTTTVLYLDGVAVTTDSTTLAGANTMAPDTWSPFTIGGAFWADNGIGRGFNGTLDEVAVYTNILTSTQVQNHYQAGTSTGNYLQTVVNDGPLLYYRLDCQGYTNAPSSLYPTAVNYGSAPVNGAYQAGIVPGQVSGPAMSGWGSNNLATPINGVFSGINAGIDSLFNPSGKQPFSAVAWFKGNPVDGRVQTIIGQGTNWAINLDGTTGHLVWSLDSSNQVTSTNILNDGNWHFVGGVYNGTNSFLYVDGALNASAAANVAVMGESSAPLFLGGDSDYTIVGNNMRYFAGELAHLAYFTNALTAAQISGLYTVANPPVTATISLSKSGGNLVLTYTGTLVSSTNVAGPYLAVPSATSPYTVSPTGAQMFFYTTNY